MPGKPTALINILKVVPANQDELVKLLKQNIEAVVTKLHGWRNSRLIAAADGASVIIYSEWDQQSDIEAMRSDPRMRASFPQILELASFDSAAGELVLNEERTEPA